MASRAVSRCAIWSTCRRSSPSSRVVVGPVAGSHCSTSAPHRNRHPHREQHLLRQGRATDRRAALRRRGVPVPAEERRLPAVARRDGRDAGRGRVRGRPAHAVERRSHATPRGHPLGPPESGTRARRVFRAGRGCRKYPTSTKHPTEEHVRDHPGLEQVLDPATAAELDLNDIARGDGTLFVRDGVGIAGRGIAARIAADEASAWLAGLEHDSTVESHGPIALGVVPFRPGAACELLVPEVVVRKTAAGPNTITVVGADREDADRLLAGATAWLGSEEATHAADPDRGELHDRTGRHRALPRRGGDRPRRGARRRSRQGGDRPADHGRAPTSRSTSTRSCAASGPASGRATATRSTGSSGRRRNCSSRSTATSSDRIPWPVPRRARATPPTTRCSRRN